MRPNFRPNMGDIVTMPLPTEWAPSVQGTGVPPKFVLGLPASVADVTMVDARSGSGGGALDPASSSLAAGV